MAYEVPSNMRTTALCVSAKAFAQGGTTRFLPVHDDHKDAVVSHVELRPEADLHRLAGEEEDPEVRSSAPLGCSPPPNGAASQALLTRNLTMSGPLREATQIASLAQSGETSLRISAFRARRAESGSTRVGTATSCWT